MATIGRARARASRSALLDCEVSPSSRRIAPNASGFFASRRSRYAVISPISRMISARPSKRSLPTRTCTWLLAAMLRIQSADDPRAEATRYVPPVSSYTRGVVRGLPVLRPIVVSRRTKRPMTRPSPAAYARRGPTRISRQNHRGASTNCFLQRVVPRLASNAEQTTSPLDNNPAMTPCHQAPIGSACFDRSNAAIPNGIHRSSPVITPGE
jgi:hypothetical protein